MMLNPKKLNIRILNDLKNKIWLKGYIRLCRPGINYLLFHEHYLTRNNEASLEGS